jgi:hypothetical protein
VQHEHSAAQEYAPPAYMLSLPVSVLSISDVWRCLIDRFDFAERGIYILYDDVKSCQCEDVHVLWSILMESHGLPPPTPTTVLRLTR